MSASQKDTLTHQAWLDFLQKYQSELSVVHGHSSAGKLPSLSPIQLERARQEWILVLKKLGCRPHSWPSLPEEIGQLQLVLQWRASDMWNNVIGVSRLSAHDPQKRPSPGNFSYQTWAKEDEQRAANRQKATTKQATNIPNDNLPIKKPEEPKSNAKADINKDKPRVAILSPRLYGLTPNLFHKIWTSGADSSGLKDYALLKWRALMKEFYSMAKEYAERMEEVLRRIQSEQEVEKLLSTYDHYHQQLADNVYKDWEQAISEWREGDMTEKESEAPKKTTNDIQTVNKGEVREPSASEKRSFSQREDHHDHQFVRHENLDDNQVKVKKTSSMDRARQPFTNRPQMSNGEDDHLPGADNGKGTPPEKNRFIRAGQQLHQPRARSARQQTHYPPTSTNIAPNLVSVDNPNRLLRTHVDRDARRAKSAPLSDIPAQRQYPPSVPESRPFMGESSIRTSAQPQTRPPIGVARGRSETISYDPPSSKRVPSELRTTLENHTGMRMKVYPPPPRRSQGNALGFEADRTSSRYDHKTTGEAHHPEVPFRDYSNLSLPTQHSQSSAEHGAPRKSETTGPKYGKTRNTSSAAPIRFSTSTPSQYSSTQYIPPKATSAPAVTDQANQDNWLTPDISAEIEAAYAEAGRIHAEKMRRIDNAYSRLEEGNPMPWESEAEDDDVEESDDSLLDTTESDTPTSTVDDTGSDFGSDSSTPTPGSPVMSVGYDRSTPQRPHVIELIADDEIPMNSQWTTSGIFREQSGREKTVRWAAAPEIRLIRRGASVGTPISQDENIYA